MIGTNEHGTVAVIVPMYNAEKTIAKTLDSICQQTYRDLDIVVIDDGSTDRSAQVVLSIASRDRRVRLIRQANAGVATARNNGAAQTNAPFLSFVDADDLWAPEKTAAQMALVVEGKPALIYCWFSQMDRRDRIYRADYQPSDHEGDVRAKLARENFIGNGSSMLMPREIFDRVGGFDPEMRAKGAQGCEDYMFAMAAAQEYPFRCVPRRLVGYRVMRGNMSSDAEKMVRSYEMVVSRFEKEMGEFAQEFADHHRDFLLWHARRAAMEGSRKKILAMIRRLESEHDFASRSIRFELTKLYIRARLSPRWAKDLAARLGFISRPRYQDVAW